MEILNSLGIDLKILVAQLINFGILIFILAKFLYKPIIKMLDQRKKRIEESLKKADEVDKKEKAIEEDYKSKMAEAKKESNKLMDDAKADAENIRKEIVAISETEAASIRSTAKAQAEIESARLYEEAKKQSGKIALMLMTKAFKYDQGEDFYKKSIDSALTEMEAKI